MDRKTTLAYERDALRWIEARSAQPRALRRIGQLAARLPKHARVADLGCGPGWYSASLKRRGLVPVAVDSSAAMLAESKRRESKLDAVRADLASLPFARGSIDAAVAFNSYQHLPIDVLPVALARLHDVLRVGAPLDFTIGDFDSLDDAPTAATGGAVEQRWEDDPFPGRLFSFYRPHRIEALLRGAGFADVRIDRGRARRFWLWIRAVRDWTLPDYLRSGIRVLFCGLNPSVFAADTGVPYGRPGNRFWPAAQRAGLCLRDRDPWHALERGVGFTDLVKRPTRSARELAPEEYHDGLVRLEQCVHYFRPRSLCFVGLDGWRRVVDRRAVAGWIDGGFAGVPAYLMPSTSGLNAHCGLDDFVRHMKAASSSV